ncbi:MAG TPA: TolC family protein [Nitrospira sp.]|nr:TolC family protein [Nitrospira sp.]
MRVLLLSSVLSVTLLTGSSFGETAGQAPASPAPGSLLTLDRAIRIALATHPLIERAQYAKQSARAATKQTKGERYPWLEASIAGGTGSLRVVTADGRTVHDQGGHGFDLGGSLPKHNENMVTGGLILNQLITDFGYTAHRILANELNEEASDKQLLTHKAQVILNVQQAYLTTLLRQRQVELAAATLEARRAFRDRVASLYRNQLKSKIDVDLLQVEVSNAEYAVLGRQNDVKQQFAALNNAMGLSGAQDYQLESFEAVVRRLAPLESMLPQGLEARPELRGARDKVQISEEYVKAVKALHFGSLSGVGVIGVSKFFDVHENGLHDGEVLPIWGAGATMRFPLFSGFKVQNQVVEAMHHKGEDEQDLQQAMNEVAVQIIRAYLNQVSNGEQIPVEQERVSVAREALSLAQERYKHGLASIVEVVQSTTLVFQAESRLAELQYVYKLGEAALGYAVGETYQRY